jgi:monovalent cation/proton antiporter MnhG/PhaG subunit
VSPRDIAIGILVGLGVAGELLCCIGLVVVRDVYDRLHYAMAASTVPPFLIVAAVLVEEGWTQPGINALLAAVVMFVGGGVIAHAIARAARSRRG